MKADEYISLARFAAESLESNKFDALSAQPKGITSYSCRAGCGACCRQLVSISPAEALHLADVVDALDEERRGAVLDRFDAAEALLREAGLFDRLMRLDDLAMEDEDHYELAREYFRLKLACPFLENESCGIYAERPALCREYLVSSPVENCDDPFTKAVEVIPAGQRLGDALGGLSAQMLKIETQLVPLSLALAWVRENPEARTRVWMRGELEARFELHYDIMLGQMGKE